MKKIGLYGGSFDPVHNAHVHCALLMKKTLDLDILIIMPAKAPPHKSNVLADGKHRLNMCRLAFEDYSGIEVSPLELDRNGKSYTCDTISSLKLQYPDGKFYMFAGADMFMTLDTWKNSDYILRNTAVVTIPRDDIDEEKLNIKKKSLENSDTEFIIIKTDVMKESSTEIRQRIANGESIADMVPQKVAEYIHKNKIYRELT